MPTYEYRCKDCDDEFEIVQAFTDDPLTECPTCHGVLRKKFAAPSISFKGSGFYKNDSRSSSKSTVPSTSSSTGSSSESSGNGKDSSSKGSEKATSSDTKSSSDSGPSTTSSDSSSSSSKESASA